jgi:hypothetical protein
VREKKRGIPDPHFHRFMKKARKESESPGDPEHVRQMRRRQS